MKKKIYITTQTSIYNLRSMEIMQGLAGGAGVVASGETPMPDMSQPASAPVRNTLIVK